jgi:hypothetical protein
MELLEERNHADLVLLVPKVKDRMALQKAVEQYTEVVVLRTLHYI